jgi:hypothetical protein
VEGIQFVRGAHLSLAEGCYLPRADLLGQVQSRLHELVFQYPELKRFVPNLLDVDLFISWNEDQFLLLVSPEKRAQLPARGMETKHLPSLRDSGVDVFRDITGFVDVSASESVRQSFAQLGFIPGFAAMGSYPADKYTDEAKLEKVSVANVIATLIQNWAKARHQMIETSRLFLSHKGINKPLVEEIDRALRLLNLKTWFDQNDLNAGDTLVRGVDQAFASCSAAVFFISKEYVDAGVIRKEIDRALHEAATRGESFRIIPLVLRQHGGSDEHVPEPLQTLVWKTVDDVQIVPTILKALPTHVQAQIAYAAPKN